MPRVKRGTKRRARRKKILERASGYYLTKSKLYRSAKESVERALKFAYTGRRQKKRQYRSLWIARISAAAKLNGITLPSRYLVLSVELGAHVDEAAPGVDAQIAARRKLRRFLAAQAKAARAAA